MIEQAEIELSTKLLTRQELAQGYRIHIDPNALTRGDAVGESNIVTQQKQAGVITGNEARKELGYPEREDDPDADSLKTAGDTKPAPDDSKSLSPQKGDSEPVKSAALLQPAATTPAPNLEQFAALFDHAAMRVGTKTDKAVESAGKRPPEEWTPRTNVLADQQAKYAAEELAPVLATIKAVTGQAVPEPQEIAQRYAQALRRHFAQLGRNEQTSPPDLKRIALDTLSAKGDDEI